MVNQFYVDCVDRDFGPFFLKFSSYFPYTAKLCINGHEYATQQLAKKNIGFGQRSAAVRRPEAIVGDLRRTERGKNRCALAQVAPPVAASLHRCRP
jgi:hypothetical protein